MKWGYERKVRKLDLRWRLCKVARVLSEHGRNDLTQEKNNTILHLWRKEEKWIIMRSYPIACVWDSLRKSDSFSILHKSIYIWRWKMKCTFSVSIYFLALIDTFLLTLAWKDIFRNDLWKICILQSWILIPFVAYPLFLNYFTQQREQLTPAHWWSSQISF